MATVKDVKGNEVAMVNDASGQCVWFPNPSNEGTKMNLWTDLFGEQKAKLMRANYLSHTKNGFIEEGIKVRRIRDMDGNVIKELDVKDEVAKKTANAAISIADAIAVYNEIKGKPGLEKACEIQLAQIKLLIPAIVFELPVEVLQFAIKNR